MSEAQRPDEDPAVVGVPPGAPDAVRSSVTGLVAGPVDEEQASRPGRDDERADRLAEDAEGGVEGSLLDAPDGAGDVSPEGPT